jgi:hypothetical protein
MCFLSDISEIAEQNKNVSKDAAPTFSYTSGID